MRWQSLLLVTIGASLTAFALSSHRLSPLQSFLSATLCGVLTCIGIMRLATSFQPIKYRDGPLVAHHSKVGAAAYSFVAIVFGALSIAVGMTFAPIGYLAIAPAAAMIGLAILRVPEVFNRRAVLTIDSEGFFDRRFTHHPVPWSQTGPLIASAASYAWPVFRPADDPGNSTLMRRLFSRLGFPFLYVSFGALDHGGGDVLLAIDRYAPEVTAALVRGD